MEITSKTVFIVSLYLTLILSIINDIIVIENWKEITTNISIFLYITLSAQIIILMMSNMCRINIGYSLIDRKRSPEVIEGPYIDYNRNINPNYLRFFGNKLNAASTYKDLITIPDDKEFIIFCASIFNESHSQLTSVHSESN